MFPRRSRDPPETILGLLVLTREHRARPLELPPPSRSGRGRLLWARPFTSESAERLSLEGAGAEVWSVLLLMLWAKAFTSESAQRLSLEGAGAEVW